MKIIFFVLLMGLISCDKEVVDSEGKKWLLQQNDTGHGMSITLSKME